MGTRITDQLKALRDRMDWVVGDPDYPEFARLAEVAGKSVEIPELLVRYYDVGIDIERARRELGSDDA